MNDGVDLQSKEKIIKILNALFGDTKIYLFGSRAKGSYSQWSDIDLGLDKGKKIDFVDIGEAKDVMVTLNIPYKVDIVDINNVSQDMKNIILKEGVI